MGASDRLTEDATKGLDEVRSLRRVNHCIGFDFHAHFGTDEGDHLHHRAGRADIAEYLAVCSTHRFSIVDVGDVNDRPHHVLHTRSGLVDVEPQVFDLLVHLMRHRERVVTKDDLLAAVWHGRIVSESALANRINAARGVIGDTGSEQRLIKTLPRKGVRFVGAVREDDGAATVRPPDLLSSTSEKPSIAVLPFLNLSGNADTDYLVDGIVEDIITALSRNRGFFVIVRNSSFSYRGRAVDVKQVARRARRPLRLGRKHQGLR